MRDILDYYKYGLHEKYIPMYSTTLNLAIGKGYKRIYAPWKSPQNNGFCSYSSKYCDSEFLIYELLTQQRQRAGNNNGIKF